MKQLQRITIVGGLAAALTTVGCDTMTQREKSTAIGAGVGAVAGSVLTDGSTIDIGERVRVAHWESDGTCRVTYRGAAWSARFAGSGTPTPGEHVIRAVDGNRLLLAPVRGYCARSAPVARPACGCA